MRQSFDERVARWMRRSNPGYLGGRSESVGPPLFPQAALETFKMPFSAGGRRPAYRVIGMVPLYTTSDVDVLTDGSSDQVEINPAIVDAEAVLADVLLLAGQADPYNVDAQVNVTAGVHLRGCGRENTVIRTTGFGSGAVVRLSSVSSLSCLKLETTEINVSMEGTVTRMFDVRCDGEVQASGAGALIDHCDIEAALTWDSAAGFVRDSFVTGAATMGVGGNGNYFLGTVFDDNVIVDSDGNWIIGCPITGNLTINGDGNRYDSKLVAGTVTDNGVGNIDIG